MATRSRGQDLPGGFPPGAVFHKNGGADETKMWRVTTPVVFTLVSKILPCQLEASGKAALEKSLGVEK